MKSPIHYITKYSEHYLIVLLLLCGYSPFTIHPIALALAAGLVLQIIFKNGIIGIMVAALFGLINLFMLLAVISEFNEFPLGNREGYVLLFVGVSIIIVNLGVCYLMFLKYIPKKLQPWSASSQATMM